jgi:hypothetical protein
VGELVFLQSKTMARAGRAGRILKATSLTLELILTHTTDESTGEGLQRNIINPAMERYRQQLEKKSQRLCEYHGDVDCFGAFYNKVERESEPDQLHAKPMVVVWE